MEWIESISKAVNYIEDNLLEDITPQDIARISFISPYYFQKGFSMLCGFSVADYIRQRRLALAGSEVVSTDSKIIDIALKYGYDSPDSFTKAFIRFHGITPTAARKNGATVKAFAPLQISFSLKGGNTMDYKIVEKSEFTVIGLEKNLTYENAQSQVTAVWQECHQPGKPGVMGMYGINHDESMKGKDFSYMVADNYDGKAPVPYGLTTKTIPAFTWAVFPCKGSVAKVMPQISKKIFSEWLPNCKDYEIAAGYNIEMYSDPTKFPDGVMNDNYYSELWIPVKHK